MEKENEGGERGELPPPPPPPPRQTRPPPPHPDVGTRTGQGAEPGGAGRGEEKTAPAAREHEPADRLEALGAGRRRGGGGESSLTPHDPPNPTRTPVPERPGHRDTRPPPPDLRQNPGGSSRRRTDTAASRGPAPERAPPGEEDGREREPRHGPRPSLAAACGAKSPPRREEEEKRGARPPERPLTAREARSGEGLHLRKTPKKP